MGENLRNGAVPEPPPSTDNAGSRSGAGQAATVLFACGDYNAGMRDFHLSLLHEAKARGERPVSVVRLTRRRQRAEVVAEHARHGLEPPHIALAGNWLLRQTGKVIPLFMLRCCWLKARLRAGRMVISSEGYCFGWLPRRLVRQTEVFFHDPEPHLTAQSSFLVRAGDAFKRWFHERRPWKALLVGSAEHVAPLQARARAPIVLMPFPRFTRHLFPPGTPPPELAGAPGAAEGYLLIYGRVDRYKGIFEWLSGQKAADGGLTALPPVVIAGRIVDDRVRSFAGEVTLIDRFIENEEVGPLFAGAAAVVMPYLTVTHSGVGDIAISFGKPAYLPPLPYFTARYEGEALARPLAELRADFAARRDDAASQGSGA